MMKEDGDIITGLTDVVWYIEVVLKVFILMILAIVVYLIVKGIYFTIKSVARSIYWSRFLKKFEVYRVYCLGREVDKSKMNVNSLHKKDWKVKISDSKRELYLSPRFVIVNADDDFHGLSILPTKFTIGQYNADDFLSQPLSAEDISNILG